MQNQILVFWLFIPTANNELWMWLCFADKHQGIYKLKCFKNSLRVVLNKFARIFWNYCWYCMSAESTILPLSRLAISYGEKILPDLQDILSRWCNLLKMSSNLNHEKVIECRWTRQNYRWLMEKVQLVENHCNIDEQLILQNVTFEKQLGRSTDNFREQIWRNLRNTNFFVMPCPTSMYKQLSNALCNIILINWKPNPFA